jgi:aryl-alcohol dehydrogenase (NADP+)
MVPLCADQGIGVIPWSPLARGRLARPRSETTSRTSDDAFGDSLYPEAERSDDQVRDATFTVAERNGVKPAQVALAWLLRNPVVTAPIIGVTRESQLHDALGALDVELTDDDVAELESPYRPHAVAGFE